MEWNETLTELQNKLAKLYPEEYEVRRICITCNIPVEGFKLQGTAYDFWFSILNKIKLEKINKIIQTAEFEKGEDFSLIIEKLDPPKTDIINLPEFKLNIQLHDYPRPKAYFAGREKELKDINDAYQTVPFIFIEGAGGIGKTQFISKFIEGLPKKDRIVWFDCKPTSQPDDFIAGSGFEELLKGKEKTDREKFSAFKDKVQEFDLTVFLDNYQEVENNPIFKLFLTFFNEYLTTGHLIIIGRDNITSPNLQPKRILLKGLGDDSLTHARRLLEHSYSDKKGIPDESLIKICNELKGYPLAIDLAVYLLSEGVSEENILQEAVSEAKSEDGGNEQISERLLNAIFTRTDASEKEKEFLKLISVYRGKVHRDAALAVIPTEIFNIKRQLARRNLLTIENDYYELHPLIREFCYEKLSDAKSIHLKAAGYFEHNRTDKLDIDLEEKIFYHLSQADEWAKITKHIIDAGRNYIILGYLGRLQNMITTASNKGESTSLFNILEGDIAEIKGDWDKAISLFEKVMEDTNDEIRIEGMIKVGEMKYRIGECQEAKEIFEKAFKESEKKGLIKLQARALNDMGLACDFFGETKDGLFYLEKALSIRNIIGEQQDIAISLHNIGRVKNKLGLMKEALGFYERSLKISEEIGNKSGIVYSLYHIGSVKDRWGLKKEALEFYERSLKRSEEIGDKSGIANSLNYIGTVKADLGQKKEALELYEKSLKIKSETGDKSGIANTLNDIGNVKNDLGQSKEALELYEKSLEIQEGIGNKSGIATSLNNIGTVKADLGQKKEALELFEKSLMFKEEIGDRSGIANSLNNIGYFLIGNKSEFKKTSLYLLRSLSMFNQMGMPDYINPWNALQEMKKKYGGVVFKSHINNAYDQLGEELKPFIDLNKILGTPVTVAKSPGRNESCPCGSGKKYKQCHGKN